jgi:hypothetical protein
MEACIDNETTEISEPKDTGNQRSAERGDHRVAITNGSTENFIRKWEMKRRREKRC